MIATRRSRQLVLAIWILGASALTAQDHDMASHQHHAGMTHGPATEASLEEFGQGAFAALAEVVQQLESDPQVDWSKVDILALRNHLVDMNRLVIDTRVEQREIPGGIEISIIGPPEAFQAAQRMVPMHSSMMSQSRGWTITVQEEAALIKVTWTGSTEAEVAKIRGLGFFGLMASGNHHQSHHRQLALGADPHQGHH